MTPVTVASQLSLAIYLHPKLAEQDDPYLIGTLKIKGDFTVNADLQAGDELHVTISDGAGEVVTEGACAVRYPTLHEIREQGIVIGTERRHVAERTL